MIRAGIFTEDDPIELLDGWLVPQMTQHPPHVLASELVERAISRILPDGWCFHSQRLLRLATSMPEPDLMVIRGDLRSYGNRLPRGEDVVLVVEVADASLAIRSSRSRSTPKPASLATGW